MIKSSSVVRAILPAVLAYPVADRDAELFESVISMPPVHVMPTSVGPLNDSKDEAQIELLIKSLMRTISTWDSVRQKVECFRSLPTGWDTFGGDPIPDQTIENALELIANIGNLGGEAEWAEPTSDGTIALQSHFGNSTVRFEIDDSEMVGVALKNPRTGPVYDDVSLRDVRTCLESDRVG